MKTKLYLTIILTFVLAFSQIVAQSNPAQGLKEIPLTGLTTADGYTFHFYSQDGKLNIGYSEVFIALTDKDNNFVQNFTVSNFYPLMDMGMSKHSTPVGKVEKIADKALYKTWFSFLMYSGQMDGSWSLGFNYTIGTTTAKTLVVSQTTKISQVSTNSAVLNDTITKIGWFKDRHCTGAVTLPLVSSCGIGCGTGSMAGCWNGGLGMFIYNAAESGSITKEAARSDEHYLLFDAQSKELVKAFLLSLPSDANKKLSVKVTGYWVASGISANSTESNVPELTVGSVDHYLNAFHVLSIEGVIIENQANSYPGFAVRTYKHTQANLAPTNLLAVNNSGGTTIKFTPPANAHNSKSNLTGYKVLVYNKTGLVQDQFTTLSNDTSVNLVHVTGFKASPDYTFTVSALYKSSNVVVESEQSTGTETQIGWFKDRHCTGAATLPLTASCGIGCGTGAGNMAMCWNGGLGMFIYNATESGSITKEVARSDAHFLLFDAQSKELVRAFLMSLPSDATGKLSIKVTGYRVANGISSNKIESIIPELIQDSVDHYLNTFHLISIEGVVIENQAKSYPGFAVKSYKIVPGDLTPSNISALNYTGGTTVKFTPPSNKGIVNSNLKGYKVQVYNKAGLVQDPFTTIKNDTTLKAINIPGFTANQDYTFTVSALYPASGVEVESEYSTVVENSMTGITLPVDNSPANNKWLQSFSYNNIYYYVSVVNPKSIQAGSQTVKAYINRRVDLLQPFQVVNDGFKIVTTPFMRSMGHGSDGNTDMVWNVADSDYEGTLNFSMDGDWRVNLKVYDAVTNLLVAGTNMDALGNGSTLYWDFYLDSSMQTGIKDINSTGISVFPTLSNGDITIVSPVEATIKVLDLIGNTIDSYQSSGRKTIHLNVPSGLYFIAVQSSGKTTVQKVIIKK